MNNQQFRRLILDNKTSKSSDSASRKDVAATPSSLGSRARSSIPMTPYILSIPISSNNLTNSFRRSVVGSSGVDFARQLREQNAATEPARKFRSSAAPKGTKLSSGYTDRAALRTGEEEGQDDVVTRVKALEEMVKLGQMEQADFERTRDEIIGGDIRYAHLVKGLDRRLLEKARRGEDIDVLGEGKNAEKEQGEEEVEDVDEALDELEDREVKPLRKEERDKKGEMPPPPPPTKLAGQKRTRDDIIRELKAARERGAAQLEPEPPKSALSSKFKKVGPQKAAGPRIEIDEKGREVLITVDENGKVKRKIRKAKSEATTTTEVDGKIRAVDEKGLLVPDKDAIPLGMDAPILPKPPLEKEDLEEDDIFAGVGAEYNPLAGDDDEEDSGSSSDSDSDTEATSKPKSKDKPPSLPTQSSTSPPPPSESNPPTTTSSKPRNYFTTTSSSETTDPTTPINPLTDQTLLSALKRASHISYTSSSTESSEQTAAKLARRKAMLENSDRDMMDMDVGFGSSRFEDEVDEDEDGGKLSKWGEDEGDGKGDKDKGAKRRKRGPKKRKGDKDSAADVLAVLKRRGKEK